MLKIMSSLMRYEITFVLLLFGGVSMLSRFFMLNMLLLNLQFLTHKYLYITIVSVVSTERGLS